MFCRTSLAEVTSDLEELQDRWQHIETCCRFDLGVCTSFLCNDSTDSPSIHTRLSVKLPSGTACSRELLGTASASPRELLPIHRVHTYPSFQPSDETHPPPYNTIPRQSFERHSSDPSNNASDREAAYEYQLSENSNHVKHIGSVSVDALNDSTSNAFDEQNVGSEYSPSQQDINVNAVHTEDKNLKHKNSKRNGSLKDDSANRHSFSNSENKNAGHKKKWWSRGKKHHSEEEHQDTNSFVLSRSKGSMPILSQK